MVESKPKQKMKVVSVDGSMIEGGGQLFRMSVALTYLM